MLKIRFKKLHVLAQVPTQAYPGDAGFDLVCVAVETEGVDIIYHTGIAVEIPEGYVGLLFPRSSIQKTALILTNSVGVIDASYRGGVMMKMRITNLSKPIYKVGDKIGQLVIFVLPRVQYEEASALSETRRGVGGYGSSDNVCPTDVAATADLSGSGDCALAGLHALDMANIREGGEEEVVAP